MTFAACRFHLALTIFGCFGGGSLYGWSGYSPAVRAAFAVSNASASMVFSLALVSFTLGVLLGPMLFGRVSLGFRLPLIAGFAALSLFASGATIGFAGFVMAYGGTFGFASGALYNYAVSMASLSGAPMHLMPISVAAFGLGGAVFGPLQVWLTSLGWGLWSTMPALICLIIVAAATLVVRPVSGTVSEPIPEPKHLIRPGRTIAILWAILAAGSCSGLIVLGFAAQLLPQAVDSVRLAGLAVFLAAMGNTLGRLSCALTLKPFGPARGIAGALILSIIALTGLIFMSKPSIVVGLLFFVAFAYGQLAAATPLLVRSQVGKAAFSGSFGWVFTGWGVAGLVGPWTAGRFLDATGSLRVPLVVCIVLAGLGLWLVMGFRRQDQVQETR